MGDRRIITPSEFCNYRRIHILGDYNHRYFQPTLMPTGGGGGGGATTVDSISRVAGAAAGGVSLTITGTGFSGSPSVLFGSSAATSVVVVNSTTITCVNPSYSSPSAGGSLVAVSVAGAVLNNAFEYHPNATVTYAANATMEDGTDGAWSPDSGAGVDSTAFAFAGTHSRLFSRASSGSSYMTAGPINNNPALNESNGVYARWYMRVPTATVDNVIGGSGATAKQIKLHLWRTTVGGGQPGYFMIGFGTAFTDGRNIVIDRDNGAIPVKFTSIDPSDQWLEFQVWCTRKSGIGRAKCWINGQLEIDHSHVDMGSDTSNEQSEGPRCGIAFVESPISTVNMYIDNAACANGMIDP